MAAAANESDACMRCKAQKRGSDKCRKTHLESEYPSTPLSQTICIALVRFRGSGSPQASLLLDQQQLEAALSAGGKAGAESALDTLRGGQSVSVAIGVDDEDDDTEARVMRAAICVKLASTTQIAANTDVEQN